MLTHKLKFIHFIVSTCFEQLRRFVFSFCCPKLPTSSLESGLTTNSIFFCSLFVKYHWFAWNDPLPEKHYSLLFPQQLPHLRLGPLKGFLSWHGALQGPSIRLVRCFWNNWHIPWLCVCWKRTFLHWFLVAKSQQNRIELVTRPGLDNFSSLQLLFDKVLAA